jgi:uncharacterized protein
MSQSSPIGTRLGFLLLGVTLAFGFIIGAEKISKGLSQVNHRRAEVSVKGVATQKMRADLGEMFGELIWRGEKQEEGIQFLTTRKDVLLKLMTDSGLAPTDIMFYPLNVNRLEPSAAHDGKVDFEKYARGTKPEYRLAASFQIKTKQVDALHKFNFQEFAVVNEVYLYRNPASYLVSHVDDSKKELLQQASADALSRAKTLVAGSGSKIGALLEAYQGVFEILPADRNGNDRGDYNSVDTSSIEKKLRLVVTMRFEIVQE